MGYRQIDFCVMLVTLELEGHCREINLPHKESIIVTNLDESRSIQS